MLIINCLTIGQLLIPQITINNIFLNNEWAKLANSYSFKKKFEGTTNKSSDIQKKICLKIKIKIKKTPNYDEQIALILFLEHFFLCGILNKQKKNLYRKLNNIKKKKL